MSHLMTGLQQIERWLPDNLLRQQTVVAVSNSQSTQILGPNRKRWAVVISSPILNAFNAPLNVQKARNVDTTTTGVKLQLQAAGGVTNLIGLASYNNDGASTPPVVALQVNDGVNNYNIAQGTGNQLITPNIPITAGQFVQWNVLTGGAASTGDFWISMLTQQTTQRVTLSWMGPVALDNGINIYGNSQPLLLTTQHVGHALQEELYGIAAFSGATISILDIYQP